MLKTSLLLSHYNHACDYVVDGVLIEIIILWCIFHWDCKSMVFKTTIVCKRVVSAVMHNYDYDAIGDL